MTVKVPHSGRTVELDIPLPGSRILYSALSPDGALAATTGAERHLSFGVFSITMARNCLEAMTTDAFTDHNRSEGESVSFPFVRPSLLKNGQY